MKLVREMDLTIDPSVDQSIVNDAVTRLQEVTRNNPVGIWPIL